MRKLTLYFTIIGLFVVVNIFVLNTASQIRSEDFRRIAKPFTMGQILRAIASLNQGTGRQKKALSDKILSDVRQRKVDFLLTRENEALLRNEGATDELIETIRQNSPRLSTPTQSPIVKSTLTAGSKEIKNSIGMEFMKIPSGSFMMGSEKGAGDEKPVHKVTINYEFYMGKYEVTIGEWKKIMGDIPAGLKSADNAKFRESDYQPVVYVSWDDAQEFIKKLNAKNDGYVYRLPSEAEWEYAARAGTTTEFAYGNNLGSTQANFEGNHPYGNAAIGKYLEKPVEVGNYQPNAWGLYDMHGNVGEWVEDIYSSSYNFSTLPTDGSPNLSVGDLSRRVFRGGAWNYSGYQCRSAFRNYVTFSNTLGFRLVARRK